MKGRFLQTEEEQKQFIADYKEAKTAKRLAIKWGMTTPTAVRYLKLLGQPVAKRGRPKGKTEVSKAKAAPVVELTPPEPKTIVEKKPSSMDNYLNMLEKFRNLRGG